MPVMQRYLKKPMGLLDPLPSGRFTPKAPRYRHRYDNFSDLQVLGHEGHLSEQQRIDENRKIDICGMDL